MAFPIATFHQASAPSSGCASTACLMSNPNSNTAKLTTMRYRVGGATSTSAASAAATVPTMMNAQMWIMVYGRTREKAITTWAGSCTPQNTAEPSMAGVKNGRPAITSTIRNQSATAAAPIRPAMNPSRRIRVNCMSFNIGSLQGGASTDPGLAPGVRTDDLV